MAQSGKAGMANRNTKRLRGFVGPFLNARVFEKQSVSEMPTGLNLFWGGYWVAPIIVIAENAVSVFAQAVLARSLYVVVGS